MSGLLIKSLLTGSLVLGIVAIFPPQSAQADHDDWSDRWDDYRDHWRNYNQWHDNEYRPYYRRYQSYRPSYGYHDGYSSRYSRYRGYSPAFNQGRYSTGYRGYPDYRYRDYRYRDFSGGSVQVGPLRFQWR